MTLPSAGSGSAAVTLKRQLKAFRCKVQLSCCAVPAGCGGRRRAPGAGLDRAGLLGCWATGRPRRGLAGWASSMERLIPARTKSLPVVLLDQQQQKEELRVTAAKTVVLHNTTTTTTLVRNTPYYRCCSTTASVPVCLA